jgi:hypothetical protein
MVTPNALRISCLSQERINEMGEGSLYSNTYRSVIDAHSLMNQTHPAVVYESRLFKDELLTLIVHVLASLRMPNTHTIMGAP